MPVHHFAFRDGVLTPASNTSAPVGDDGDLLIIRGSADRRVSFQKEPPYFSEEGFVMVDRRDGSDRRVKAASH